jgi:hypothetical protein
MGRVALSLLLLPLMSACTQPTGSAELFKLKPESAAHRAAQTRFFETPDEIELLSASAAVLQDLGFQVTETAHRVGYLRATKERSARERGQSITRFFVFLISMGRMLIPVDLHQKIEASMVARPANADATRHEVRIQFYRVIWQGAGVSSNGQQAQQIPPGIQKMEMVRDPVIYQQFFAKLSKAVFLEAQKI